MPSASSPENRKRTDSTRNGGQYSTTIRDEVKAELQIAANVRPSASDRQSTPAHPQAAVYAVLTVV